MAHELSNPLSFVKNFSEGTGQLSEELFEMLERYRAGFSDDDVGLLDDVKGEMEDSLERVRANSLRALTIVKRMQSIGVAGGEPQMANLHAAVRHSVQVGCDAFRAEWRDFDELVRMIKPDKTLAELEREQRDCEVRMDRAFHHVPLIPGNQGASCGWRGVSWNNHAIHGAPGWKSLAPVAERYEKVRAAVDEEAARKVVGGRPPCGCCLAVMPAE